MTVQLELSGSAFGLTPPRYENCSPAGQEGFFEAVGVPVASRTETLPKPDPAAEAAFKAKAEALAPKYRTELLKLE